MDTTQKLEDWFPSTTIHGDELFPREFERLGLVLTGGTRMAVTFHVADPDVLRGITIATGTRVDIAWVEIERIYFFDRVKH